MVNPVYFLMNHSKKEFWSFENNRPLYDIIKFAVENIKDWKITDEIYIESECACYGIIPPLVMDRGYKERWCFYSTRI